MGREVSGIPLNETLRAAGVDAPHLPRWDCPTVGAYILNLSPSTISKLILESQPNSQFRPQRTRHLETPRSARTRT
jgi:hypothetical protein